LDPGKLRNLLARYQSGDLSPEQLAKVGATGLHTAEFINTSVKKGAIYIGHNGLGLSDALHDNPHEDAYIMYFSPTAMKNDPAWQPNYDLLLELLQTRDPKTAILIVDCEATKQELEKVHISQFQGGEEVSGDVFEDRQFMADKSFAVCPENTLETENIQLPIQRRHVTIPCPGKKCSVAKVREWLCPRCRAPVEYGYTDKFVYCNCGSVAMNYMGTHTYRMTPTIFFAYSIASTSRTTSTSSSLVRLVSESQPSSMQWSTTWSLRPWMKRLIQRSSTT
jgi:hypothetical protein